jgi:hypothetical protein
MPSQLPDDLAQAVRSTNLSTIQAPQELRDWCFLLQAWYARAQKLLAATALGRQVLEDGMPEAELAYLQETWATLRRMAADLLVSYPAYPSGTLTFSEASAELDNVARWCVEAQNDQRRRPARRHPTGRRLPRDRKTEARDRWIYQQCCKGRKYQAIAAELGRVAQQKNWTKISSKQGIHQAAVRYARRHQPAPPPRRQDP